VQAIRWNTLANKNFSTTSIDWFSLNMRVKEEARKLNFYFLQIGHKLMDNVGRYMPSG
jgi:hypothetical protein